MHPKLARYLVELGRTVSGSDAEFRSRPLVNANICSISPLSHDAHGIECALIYAEAGMPVSFMAMPVMGTTAPANPMAALIVGEAEIVSGLVLLQLAYPGTPVIHSNLVTQMDPLSARCIIDVSIPVGNAAVQMAKEVWQVPSLGGIIGCSNARDIGWESGMVDGQATIVTHLDGADLSGNTGILDDAMTLYPENIILIHETLERAYELLHPFEFSEEDLAIEVTKNIGPRGHFLLERHTVKNLRQMRHSKILRQPVKGGGERDPRDVALEQYKKIADTYVPKPLPKNTLVELEKIMAAADREAEAIKS
jgi:trimethylamine---corrinoid protein Co-methyltransferase